MINGYKIIALCISRVHDEESARYIIELNKRVIKKGYRLFVYGVCSDLYTGTGENGETAVFDLIDFDRIDALIIYAEKIYDKSMLERIIEKALNCKMPVVTVGESMEGCMKAGFDYKKGFEQVVRHVIEYHGITNIHFMAGQKNNAFSDDRMDVLKEVLAENGLSFDAEMVSYGEFWDAPTRAATEKLIQENRLPKAFICANDIMAITVCNVLRNNGYRVPQDIIVTGFDGIDAINFSEPKVTSVSCRYSDLAEESLELIERYFEKKIGENRVSLVIPNIIVSASCGCASPSDITASEYLTIVDNRFYIFREANQELTKRSLQMQNCETPEELAERLHTNMLIDLCCIVKKECIEEGVNPNVIHSEDTFGDEMYLLYDTDQEGFMPHSFSLQEIAPDLDRLLSLKRPLIFTALYFRSIPLGYVCFHFEADNSINFNNFDRITLIVNALNSAIGGYRNIRYQQSLTKQIEDMYKLDNLTGLYNRNGFMREYRKIIQCGEERNRHFTVILADLDGLKYINDNFGHGEGDRAIRTVALALKNACPQDALCGRFGGDEMLAVLEGESDTESIRIAVDNWLSDYNTGSGKPYQVKASLGIYVAQGEEISNFEELLKKADKLMYLEKNRRKAKQS